MPTLKASRRIFLRNAVLTALAPSARGQQPPAANVHVDAHVHVWTPDTKSYPLADGFTKEKNMVPPSFTPEELFAQCRPSGVGKIVLIQMNFYRFDNSYMLDSMAAHPGVFSGVAVVDESQADLGDTMKRLAAKGVRGFRLSATRVPVETWTTSSGMKAMWTLAADTGLAMCPLIIPNSLPGVLRMCRDFPKTRVVIDHFARVGQDWTTQPADLDSLCRLADFENVHVKTSAFYNLGAKKAPYTDLGPMIRRLRDAFGAQRLMWATDCPFQLQNGHTYSDSIALIRDRLDFLSDDDKSWMLRKTAEKIFFS